MQKERIREMRRYVKEQRQQRAERHHNEITSLENQYGAGRGGGEGRGGEGRGRERRGTTLL